MVFHIFDVIVEHGFGAWWALGYVVMVYYVIRWFIESN